MYVTSVPEATVTVFVPFTVAVPPVPFVDTAAV